MYMQGYKKVINQQRNSRQVHVCPPAETTTRRAHIEHTQNSEATCS